MIIDCPLPPPASRLNRSTGTRPIAPPLLVTAVAAKHATVREQPGLACHTTPAILPRAVVQATPPHSDALSTAQLIESRWGWTRPLASSKMMRSRKMACSRYLALCQAVVSRPSADYLFPAHQQGYTALSRMQCCDRDPTTLKPNYTEIWILRYLAVVLVGTALPRKGWKKRHRVGIARNRRRQTQVPRVPHHRHCSSYRCAQSLVRVGTTGVRTRTCCHAQTPSQSPLYALVQGHTTHGFVGQPDDGQR